MITYIDLLAFVSNAQILIDSVLIDIADQR